MSRVQQISTYERRLSRGVRPLTVYISPEDIRRIKVIAALEGKTLGELIVSRCALKIPVEAAAS